MKALRYRSGLDGRTGHIITGWRHCAHCVERTWGTRTDVRLMLLDFGADIHKRLAEDITPALALVLYDDLTTAVINWEPEYRISTLQLVNLTREGGLGLRHAGTYYPEGRFGNYDAAETVTATLPLRRIARGQTVQ